jgi:N-succinyldiaminopimelate aminotransferase
MSQVATSSFNAMTPVSPFARLADLLAGIEPGEKAIDLTIGEPHHPMPDFLMHGLTEAQELFGKYPPIRGTHEFRNAVAAWLARRYPGLEGMEETDLGIIPLSGTREGLFHVAFSARGRRPDIENPIVLMPNPFYHTYAAAAGACGAQPVFLRAAADTGFLPDLEAITEDVLAQTIAFYLSTPANPQGAVADEGYLRKAIQMAREHDFILIADECYSEVYTQNPPPGALETAWKTDKSLSNVITMQSFSKRSNLPGLRAGYCAGDSEFVEAFASFRNVVAPQTSLTVLHACARILEDEDHVITSRELYRQKFEAADAILDGQYGYRRPEGGFFLWLNVGDFGGSEEAVKTLWKECGVKLLPGRFLAREEIDGTNCAENFVRVAMVHDLTTTDNALNRIVSTLK